MPSVITVRKRFTIQMPKYSPAVPLKRKRSTRGPGGGAGGMGSNTAGGTAWGGETKSVIGGSLNIGVRLQYPGQQPRILESDPDIRRCPALLATYPRKPRSREAKRARLGKT